MRVRNALFYTLSLLLCLLLRLTVFGQTQPSNLTITTARPVTNMPANTVFKGSPGDPYCYTLTVPNGGGMTLDLRYTFTAPGQPPTGPHSTDGWPTLDGSSGSPGSASLCMDSGSLVGAYNITGVRNHAAPTANYVGVGASVYVAAVPPAPASGSLTYTKDGLLVDHGWAGDDYYRLHADNAGLMKLDLKGRLVAPGETPPTTYVTWTVDLNGNGDWNHTLGHYDLVGNYEITAMKNHWRTDWTSMVKSYYLHPPRPKSLSVAPSSVFAGSNYDLTVGNGGNIFLDVKYTITPPNGSPITMPMITHWPNLLALSQGHPDGKANINAAPCTMPGRYRYLEIKNWADDHLLAWFVTSGNNYVDISGPGAPQVASRTPIAGKPGDTNVAITINGQNLCAVTFPQSQITPAGSGLSFDPAPPTPSYDPATSVTTTFSIAAGAAPRKTTVTLATSGGTTTFPFYISSLIPPAVTGLDPKNGVRGTNVDVTITGTNLLGATLSTTHSGLSFTGVDYNDAGTALMARFVIAPDAYLGTPVITVKTPAGATTTQLFSVGTFVPFSREYVYLGERLLAVDSGPTVLAPHSTNTIPPTAPTTNAQLLNGNSAQINISGGSAANGGTVVSFDLKKNGVFLTTVPATQASHVDTTLSPNTAYTFHAIARDTGGLTSAQSNGASLTTPTETIPPSTPGNFIAEWQENWGSWEYFSWSSSTDTGGSGLAGYHVMFVDWGGTEYLLSGEAPLAATELWFDFAGEDFSNWAGFRVYAVDGAGNLSMPANWP